MSKGIHIRVYGRVQGVWFRATAKKQADRLKLNGCVRNQPDGSVSIEAEGTQENLNKFIEWCHDGPEFARVDKCIWEEKPLQHYTEFEIIRY